MINEQDEAVANALKEWSVTYTTILAEIGHKRDDWESDKWVILINGTAHEFYTGIGHRIIKTIKMSGNGSYHFSKTQKAENKKLAELIGVSEKAEIWKFTGKMTNSRSRIIADQRPTYTAPPTQASVLHALIWDADSSEQPFRDWCSDFGFDTDSRKAERMYFDCQDTAEKLRKAFKPHQLDTLRELLEDY